MKPIEFPQQNTVIAKDQPPYMPLPAFRSEDGEVTACWGMDWRERLRVLVTGRVYVTLLTFNRPVTPSRVSARFDHDWPWFVWTWMARENDSLWAWVDCKIGRYWYVFMWRKGGRPSLYRSTDATPPMNNERGSNDGRWIFGRGQAGE